MRRGLGMQLSRVMGAATIREMVARITMIAARNLMVSVGVYLGGFRSLKVGWRDTDDGD